MNYDTQYAFSHGLASAPHFQTLPQQQQQHLRQQFQPQQVFQQQQYGQIAPTSNVFFQFTAGGNPIFQQKDIPQMAALATAGLQQTPLGAQHAMVTSPFVKQGLPVRMEGNCVHLIGGGERMIYQPQAQQSDLKIITANPDARMLQQHAQLDTGLGLPQNATATILGLDMMGGQPQPLLDQGSLDIGNRHQPQQQSIPMPGQGGMLSYSKQQPFSNPWLQPQQQVSSSTGNLQHQQQQTQSALPSFTHLWSQFQQQKSQTSLTIQQPQQQTHMNTIQQSQQFQNQIQPSPQFATPSNFSALTSMPMISLSQFQDQSQQQSPLPILPNQVACFSPCGPNSTPSPCAVDRHVPASDNVGPNRGLTFQGKGSSCQSTHSVPDDSLQHSTPTLLTDSSSVPPKVTVILDSLPHCETFPPTTHFQGGSETALKLGASTVIPCTASAMMRNKQRHVTSTSNGQLHLHQKKHGVSRSLKPISSTGSSMERSSSESSSFSSPPYAITPPNSHDSLFSPVAQVFHPDEHMLSDSLLDETAASLGLSSSSLLPALSPSSMSSSSPLQNTPGQLKPGEKNFSLNLDGGKGIHPFTTQGNTTTLTSVATVLALSSPSTTTVITAMASSHQLVTTTTSTTSVTLASHCLIGGSTTGCITSTPSFKPTEAGAVDDLINRDLKPKSIPMNPTKSNEKKMVNVPFSWHRKQLDSGLIVYLSPSGTVLESHEQICQYLLSESTCKCGLECPIQVKELFSFDPFVESLPWTSDTDESSINDRERAGSGGKQREDLRKLCNHRRQVLALAALQNSQSHLTFGESSMLAGKKRERKKSASGGENLILSPLKRLKTSITNAVNRHAFTSSKKKPQESSDSLLGLNKQPTVSPRVLSVSRQECLSSENSPPLSSTKVESSTFLNSLEVHKQEQEMILSHSSVAKHLKSRTGQPTSSSGEIEDNFPRPSNFESLKGLTNDLDLYSSKSRPSNISSFPMEDSNKDVEISSTTGSEEVNASLPISPAMLASSSSQPTDPKENFPKHSTPLGNTSDAHLLLEPFKQSEPSPCNIGFPKNKAKRPKFKKEKIKPLFSHGSSTPCFRQTGSKITLEDDLPLPSSTVSFFENPTVFVAQQTAMINNSMASCKMDYSSPEPSVLSPSPTDTSIKSEERKESLSTQQQDESLKACKSVRKEETGTDSNKSFPDGTENDSAYLSQTGSDQERSDTIDGSDSSLDTYKLSDVYDFNCSEDHKAESGIVHVNSKGSDGDVNKGHTFQKFCKPPQSGSTVLGQNLTSAVNKGPILPEKSSMNKSKLKQKSSPQCNKKRTNSVKNGLEDPFKIESIGSLNKELSDLLASDNWNIPAVQQVLAQYSGGDPGQLNAAIQQVLSQASTAGTVFPVSNFLTSATQDNMKVCTENKKVLLNGVISTGDAKSYLHEQRKEPTIPQTPGAVKKLVVDSTQQSSGDLGLNVKVTVPKTPKQETQQNNPSLLKAAKPKSKSGAAIATSRTNGQSMQASTCQQTADAKPKLGASMPPAVPSSCTLVSSGSNTVVLNGLSTTRMVVTPQAAASVSGMTTLVSKTAAPMGVGLNPTLLGAATTPASQPQLLAPSPQQQQQSVGNSCIINATNHQIGKLPGNGGQPTTLPAANTQQLMAPSGHQPTHLTAPQTANTQIMNALSVQGLNPSQQLLLQQMSPCNPVSQLSPAIAAQLLSQNQQQQQLPQVSPSFLAGGHPQIQKLPQNSVLGSQTGIFASVPLPSFSATSVASNCSGLFTQANTCVPAQPQPRPAEASLPALLNASVECTDQLAHSLPQVKDMATAVSLASASMFAAAATSQPVFVIPQANASPMVQVLGSTQSLTTATDLNVQQQNNSLAAQLFGQQQSQQAAPFDTSQLQNLLSGGFNPLALQQTINTLNLSGVHQQQQQLQMLQLQQLMLQQLQNHQNPGLQGISIPGPQAAPQALVNAVMPTQSLQLSSMVDMNTIHPSLSPVAAATASHQNLLGNPLSQPQLHITSSLGTQPVVQGSASATVSMVQNANLQKMQQSVVKTIPNGSALIQAPAVTTAAGKHCVNTLVAAHQNQPPVGRAQPLAHPVSTTKPQAPSASPAPTSTSTPASLASSSSKSSGSSKPSKSKSKSKKSENKKVLDPESERNEEDIAATVQQILAQAVQQQRELQLAAKNQPPPPPKSKSKKSQGRSKASSNQLAGGGALAPALPAAAATKEHDLGKLPSIMSDDVVIHKSEQCRLSTSKGSVQKANCVVTSSLVQPLQTAVCDSFSHPLAEPVRPPQQLEHQQPTPASLQHQPQSTFLSPLGSVPPPPPPSAIAPMAAARPAQSSQPVGPDALVTLPVPPKQFHLVNQAGILPGKPSPQVLHKNGAVDTESSIQTSLSSPGGGTKRSAPNKNSSVSSSPGLAQGHSNRKSSISLKDHLSSIISKDKDSSKKKANGGTSVSRPNRTKDSEEFSKAAQVMSHSQQKAVKLESGGPKVLRKSIK